MGSTHTRWVYNAANFSHIGSYLSVHIVLFVVLICRLLAAKRLQAWIFSNWIDLFRACVHFPQKSFNFSVRHSCLWLKTSFHLVDCDLDHSNSAIVSIDAKTQNRQRNKSYNFFHWRTFGTSVSQSDRIICISWSVVRVWMHFTSERDEFDIENILEHLRLTQAQHINRENLYTNGKTGGFYKLCIASLSTQVVCSVEIPCTTTLKPPYTRQKLYI